MRIDHFLTSAALLAMATCAAGQDREAVAMQAANSPTSAASLETVQLADRRDFFGTDSTAINLTLPRESSSFKMSILESSQQKQAWCAQQGQARPESSNLFRTNERLASGCYDRGAAVSGRDLLIYSTLQLAVRQATSLFSD